MRQPANVESGKKLSRKALRNADQRGPLAAVLAAESVSTSRSGSRRTSRNTSRNVSRVASRTASLAPSGASDDKDAHRLPYVSDDDANHKDDEDDEEADLGDVVTQRHQLPVISRAVEILRARKRSNKASRLAALRSITQTLRGRYLGGVQGRDARSAVEKQVAALAEILISTVHRSESTGSRSTGGDGYYDDGDGDENDQGDDDGDEKRMTLEALSVAALSCPPLDAGRILSEAVIVVRQACRDPHSSSHCAATAVRILGIMALFSGGADKMTATELLRFLLKIVETDGESVHHLDDAAIVTAALQTWAFVASFLVSAIALDDKEEEEEEESGGEWQAEAEEEEEEAEAEEDEENQQEDESQKGLSYSDYDDGSDDSDGSDGDDRDDDDDHAEDDEDFFVAHSRPAFDAFVDQLDSTDVDVQLSASVAICLLFEASRAYQTTHDGRPLPLRRDPAELAQQMRLLGRGGAGARSAKAIARKLRRHMREGFANVATSLELGVGPGYRPSRPTAWSNSTRPKTARYRGGSGSSDDDAMEDTSSIVLSDQSAGNRNDVAAASAAAIVFSHQNHLRVRNRDRPIDTWALDVRVDLLRGMLRGGFTEHLAANPTVCSALEASALRTLRRRSKPTQRFKKRVRWSNKTMSSVVERIEMLSPRKQARMALKKAKAQAATVAAAAEVKYPEG